MNSKFWRREEDHIVCELCPRNCKLSHGQKGFCFVRENRDDSMILTTYGKSTGFCIDPIEKKPLNHFYPGTSVLSFGTAGCNLGCKFCQNWDISKSKEIEILSAYALPEDIVATTCAYACKSIAYTYNDPIIWAEYAIDTAKLARSRGIKNVAVTSGYISDLARADFYEHMDAVNIDLKAFTESFYKKVTLSHLQPVLDTISWVKDHSDTWLEITNLIIPDENDSDYDLQKMVEWLSRNVGDETPIHFSAFHPDYKMLNKPRTSVDTLFRAREIAIAEGLKYVYVGNVHHAEAQSTLCPKCKATVVERDWYELGGYYIKNSACVSCGYTIAGRFSDEKGNWGSKRMPVEIVRATASNPQGEIPMSQKEKNKRRKKEKKKTSSSKSKKNIITAAEQDPHELLEKEVKAPEKELVSSEILSDNDKKIILAISRQIVTSLVRGEEVQISFPEKLYHVPIFGLFVSLKRGDLLRACKGNWTADGIKATRALGELLGQVCRDAVFSDNRFPRMTNTEIDYVSIEISIMHSPFAFRGKEEDILNTIDIGTHGLVLLHPQGRSVFLPEVPLSQGWNKVQFCERLCQKAGLDKESWKESESSFMRFETIHFESSPIKNELRAEYLSQDVFEAIVRYLDALETGEVGEIELPQLLGVSFSGVIGVQFKTYIGLSATKFGTQKSLLELLQANFVQLQSHRSSIRIIKDRITSVTIFCQSTEIQSVDYPHRMGTIPYGMLMGQMNGSVRFFTSQEMQGRDPISLLCESLEGTIEDWVQDHMRLTSFQMRTITKDESIVGLTKRMPQFNGKFYPADPEEMYKTAAGFLQQYADNEKRFYPAILLPHAGWQFCGNVLSHTIAGALIPSEVIIISPKHTSNGSACSISSNDFWEIPGAQIPVIDEFREFISMHSSVVAVESAAHTYEHGVEVLLPFLKILQPDLRILPLVVFQINLNEFDQLAEVLSKLYLSSITRTQRAPLFVISSDMNHYDSDDIGREKDILALKAIEEGDPRKLLETCATHKISMCGVLPTALIMQVLNSVYRAVDAKLVDYGTSGEVTGDLTSVVGYAGIRFSPAESSQ